MTLLAALIASTTNILLQIRGWRREQSERLRRDEVERASETRAAMTAIRAEIVVVRLSLIAVLSDCIQRVHRGRWPGMPCPARLRGFLDVYSTSLGKLGDPLLVRDVANFYCELDRLHQFRENVDRALHVVTRLNRKTRIQEAARFVCMLARTLEKCQAVERTLREKLRAAGVASIMHADEEESERTAVQLLGDARKVIGDWRNADPVPEQAVDLLERHLQGREVPDRQPIVMQLSDASAPLLIRVAEGVTLVGQTSLTEHGKHDA